MARRTGLVRGEKRAVQIGLVAFAFLLTVWGTGEAQPLRSSVTLRRGSVTLRVFLEEPRIPMGSIFLLKIQAVAPGDLPGTAVQYELPPYWADRVVQLSAISDRETFERGGRIWTRITYSHRLAPLILGRVRFDGLQVTVLKERFSVPTIEGIVVGGAAVEPERLPEEPIRVTATAAPTQVFVGEQVVYTLRFAVLASAELAQPPTYETPATEGFWTEEFPQITRTYQGGYEVQQVRLALFPLRAGELQIGAGKITARLQGSPLAEEFQTKPIKVRAIALPQPTPEGFHNLVGQVIASVSVSPKSIRAGETLTVRLRVEGTANLRHLEEPPPLSLPNAVVGLPRTRFDTFERDESLWFVKEWTWRVVPQKEGTLTIPSFRIPYFDPKERRYKVAATQPMTMQVLPSAAVPAEATPLPQPTPFASMLPFLVGVVIVGLLAVAIGLRYWHRQRLLAAVPVPDPQLRQTVLTLQKQGTLAFGRAVRDWLREQIYQRTGVLLSLNDPPEKVQQLLLAKGVSEAAIRSICEAWERTGTSLAWDEAVSLLHHVAELPQRL